LISNINNRSVFKIFIMELSDSRFASISIKQILDVSPFHLIVWIFMVDEISIEQKKFIRSIYGDFTNVFNPTPKNIEEFKHTMEYI